MKFVEGEGKDRKPKSGRIKLFSPVTRFQAERRVGSLWEEWRAAIIPGKSDAARTGYAIYSCLVNVEGIEEIVRGELYVNGRYQTATLIIKTENPEDFLPYGVLYGGFTERAGFEPGMRWSWGTPLKNDPNQVWILRCPTKTALKRNLRLKKSPRSRIAADFAGALERITGGGVKVTPNIVQA